MRTLDSQYIVSLVENLVGGGVLQELIEQSINPDSDFDNHFQINPILGPLLKPKIKIMTTEKLAEVILYSDQGFQLFKDLEPSDFRKNHWRNMSPLGRLWDSKPAKAISEMGGRVMLEYLALATILNLAQDIIAHGQWLREEVEEEVLVGED